VLNKTDLVTSDELEQLQEIIVHLNPKAKILQSHGGKVSPTELLGTGLFTAHQTASHPGWMSVPRGQEETETEEYGISSFVYRSRRPFHPKRLNDAIDAGLEGGFLMGVLRSKGLAWIASRNDWAYNWSQAGCSVQINPAGYWWAAAPEDQIPEDDALLSEIRSHFDGPYGDRRQELIFIGQSMDELHIRDILDDCLLADEELARGPEAWLSLEDPFPPIEFEVGVDDEI
jgi:G3E family GTPase